METSGILFIVRLWCSMEDASISFGNGMGMHGIQGKRCVPDKATAQSERSRAAASALRYSLGIHAPMSTQCRCLLGFGVLGMSWVIFEAAPPKFVLFGNFGRLLASL